MRVIIAGATGFIGRALCGALTDAGHEVTALARRSVGGPRPFKTVLWDGGGWRLRTAVPGGAGRSPLDGGGGGSWASAFEGVDAVVNLCGSPVARRWTEPRKAGLLESRVGPTRAIVEAIAAARRGPRVLINASAVGYYGDAGDADCGEDSPKGRGFLADLCAAWEAAAKGPPPLRTVLLRVGVVLAADGGALPMMSLPFWLRLGGPLGSGRQWVPWITRHDLVRAVSHILESGLSGPVNAAAPQPATNKELSEAIGRALDKPCWLRAPAFGLRLALGEMADMLLFGQRALPFKLLESGFSFEHRDIDSALKAVFS